MALNIHSHQHLIGPAVVTGGHAEIGATLKMEFPRLRFSTLTTGDAARNSKVLTKMVVSVSKARHQ